MPNPRIVKVNTISFENEFDWRWNRYYQDTNPSLIYRSETLDYPATQQQESYQDEVNELIESYNGSEIQATCLDFQSLTMPVYLCSSSSLKLCADYNNKPVFTAHNPALYDIAPPVYSATSSAIWESQKPSNFSYCEFFRKVTKNKYNSRYQNFKFNSNTGFENLLLESTITQNLSENEHLRLIEGAEVKAWIPKAFTSGTSPLQLEHKSVTQRKLNRTFGAIVPILVPILLKNTANSETVEQEAYFYTFLINADLLKINKYKRAIRYFLLYIERFICYSGLYYADKDSYDGMIYDNPYMRFLAPDHLSLYHSICDNSVKRSFEENSPELLSLESLFPIISERTLPEDYLSKKSKLDKKIQLLTQSSGASIQESSHNMRAELQKRLSLLQSKRYQEQRINSLLQRLEQEKQLLQEGEANIQKSRPDVKTAIQKLHSTIATTRSYLKAKMKFICRQKDMHSTLLDLLETTPLEIPKTEKNLLQDFAIESITLNFQRRGQLFVLDAAASKNDLLAYLAAETPTIESLTFLTKTPSKIRVDGKDENARVGGPYKVKVTAQQLTLTLAQPNSYIGIDGRYLVFHPHVSGRTLLTHTTSACLGEASPLIYAAFQTNRISRIILAANAWLTSANSADSWGKRYVYFPYWSDYQKYLEWQSAKNPTSILDQEEQDQPAPAIDEQLPELSTEPLQEVLQQEAVEYTRYTSR